MNLSLSDGHEMTWNELLVHIFQIGGTLLVFCLAGYYVWSLGQIETVYSPSGILVSNINIHRAKAVVVKELGNDCVVEVLSTGTRYTTTNTYSLGDTVVIGGLKTKIIGKW
jgi:hypothetical protein